MTTSGIANAGNFTKNGSYVSLCVDGKAQDWSSALAIVTTILRYAIVIIIMHIDGLAQDCSNSSASALELQQSGAKSSIWLIQSASYQSDNIP